MRHRIISFTMLLLVMSLGFPADAVASAKGADVPLSAPATPIQESPSNGATDLPTTVTVRWTRSNPGETYRVQVSLNPNLSAPIADARLKDATGYTVFGLKNDTVYYWRVNASVRRQTSAWSPVWSFRTTNKSAVAAPTLVSPENGAGVFPASQGVTLVWSAVEGAESYDFQVSNEPSFSAPFIQWYGYVGTSKHVTGLEEGYTSNLYWRVRSRNAGGTGPWSEVRTFTVDIFQ